MFGLECSVVANFEAKASKLPDFISKHLALPVIVFFIFTPVILCSPQESWVRDVKAVNRAV